VSDCEVCEKPIADGQEVVHPEEGDSYCARCVVDLIGADRDAVRAAARAVIESAEPCAVGQRHVRTKLLDALAYAVDPPSGQYGPSDRQAE
jgi:hypothetical protein